MDSSTKRPFTDVGSPVSPEGQPESKQRLNEKIRIDLRVRTVQTWPKSAEHTVDMDDDSQACVEGTVDLQHVNISPNSYMASLTIDQKLKANKLSELELETVFH